MLPYHQNAILKAVGNSEFFWPPCDLMSVGFQGTRDTPEGEARRSLGLRTSRPLEASWEVQFKETQRGIPTVAQMLH